MAEDRDNSYAHIVSVLPDDECRPDLLKKDCRPKFPDLYGRRESTEYSVYVVSMLLPVDGAHTHVCELCSSEATSWTVRQLVSLMTVLSRAPCYIAAASVLITTYDSGDLRRISSPLASPACARPM